MFYHAHGCYSLLTYNRKIGSLSPLVSKCTFLGRISFADQHRSGSRNDIWILSRYPAPCLIPSFMTPSPRTFFAFCLDYFSPLSLAFNKYIPSHIYPLALKSVDSYLLVLASRFSMCRHSSTHLIYLLSCFRVFFRVVDMYALSIRFINVL